MIKERLFERIRHLEKNPEYRGERNFSIGLRSIISHLQKLLNTRQGNAQIAEDYGIPDITNFPQNTLSETSQTIELLFEKAIQKYEPRLKDIKVSFEPVEGDILNLRFKLEGFIADEELTPVEFETVISTDGWVNIKNRV
ncbi:MAG: type VI secretion system baseplate subunit TssE [Candidatus Cloacimonetes bacterium]|nr:type VI secretion system baseplate subunit TssE [Candidatus Cloacimonadota bacterium]